jgi:hypothetical protein
MRVMLRNSCNSEYQTPQARRRRVGEALKTCGRPVWMLVLVWMGAGGMIGSVTLF